MENERLNFEELQQKRVELGLADYLIGGKAIACGSLEGCTAGPGTSPGTPGVCLPAENWCHE